MANIFSELKKSDVLLMARAQCMWTLFASFAFGAVMSLTTLVYPSLFGGNWHAFIAGSKHVVPQIPPFNWLGFSWDQIVAFGLLMNVAGIVSLFVYPQMASLVVFVASGWRQFVLGVVANSQKISLPNHPFCGFQSPHCLTMDLVRLGMLAAAVMVYFVPENMTLLKITRGFAKRFSKVTDWWGGVAGGVGQTNVGGRERGGGGKQTSEQEEQSGKTKKM